MNNLPRYVILAFSCFGVITLAAAEERICRYCDEGRSHLLPLGLDLQGKFHYAPDRKVDVLHIKLDVTPDFEKRTVSGSVSITSKPIAKPVELLELDAKDISVRKVACDQAAVKDFVSTRESLQILFKEPIEVGTAFTVVIEYTAQPNAGLYFRTPAMGYPETDTHIWTQGETHEARHWFPCFDYPNERSSTEVICHVPQDMTVLSNGVRKGELIDPSGLKAVRWYHEKPHANYLICLVAGHLKGLKKTHRDVPLGFYTQPSLAKHAANSFRDTPDIMAFFEEEIGVNFPWPKYDQVTILDFTAGGMENTTLTTLTDGTIFAKATENIRTTRGLDAHELAHQWFGDYVTCKDWSHLWLNEGFATYYTHLYEGSKFGRDAMLYGLYRDATGRILTQGNDKKPIVYNAYKNPMEQFDYRSYPKGSWVLHMLRSQLGEDLYRKCIKAYLEKHALTSVVSDDLRQVIEEKSGRPMDRFFDQWLYHARHPDLKISYQWLPKQGVAKVNIKQTQKLDDDVLQFHFPTKLRFAAGDMLVDYPINVTKIEEDFYVPLEKQPEIVRFDPDYSVLANVSFDKPNGMLRKQLENKEDMVGRLLACKLLGDRKTHESVELLTKALQNDSFHGVRIAAASALSKHETDESLAALADNWATQTDARVRQSVVEKLTNRYRDETPALIKQVLEKERNPAILAAAIRGLGRFHGPETRQALIKFLGTDSFRNELAVAAMSAIRQLDDDTLQPAVFDALRQNASQFRTRDYGRGLETLAHTSRRQKDRSEVREFLAKHLDHPKVSVQAAAIQALGILGDPKAITGLESLSQSENERISRPAQQAVSKLREAKPTTPREIIELRKEIAEVKKESSKLKTELKSLREKLDIK
jgi:aminopeptidase N